MFIYKVFVTTTFTPPNGAPGVSVSTCVIDHITKAEASNTLETFATLPKAPGIVHTVIPLYKMDQNW